jgi:hypothetical protein
LEHPGREIEYIPVVRRMNDMELSTHVGSPPSNRGFTTTPSPVRRQASLVDGAEAAAGDLLPKVVIGNLRYSAVPYPCAWGTNDEWEKRFAEANDGYIMVTSASFVE